jgi:hypothetical protein
MANRAPLVALFAAALLALPAAAQDAADAPAADSAAPDAAAETAPDASDEAAADEGEAEDEGATTHDPTEAPGAAQMGSLTISSSPAGKVFIDGEDTGLSTPLIDHQVTPGTHTVKIVEEATGRTKEVTFHLEAGAVLNLNVNLPEAEPVDQGVASTQPADGAAADGAEPATVADAAATQEDDWSWMTVAGWASLGIGTLGLLAGAVILTTPTDPNQGPLGFGLFGAGAGLVLGGGVLLYLDSELMGGSDDPAPTDDAAAEEESEATASLMGFGRTAFAE